MSQPVSAAPPGAAGPMEMALRRAVRALDRIPLVGPVIRRGLRVGWWAVSGQLPQRFRQWQAARHGQSLPPPPPTPPFALVEVASAGSLELPLDDAPEVSVIIPTYGQVTFTLGCLSSIAAHPPKVPIEVLVIDDAYPGPETASLAKVRGIRLIRNPENLGFLRTCNAAARQARGRYLLFLNNDTQVLANWLDPMVGLFHSVADAGIVGSKLVFPDGRLQEAGGIIWRDATGWNYGRNADPAAAMFNYVRDADYCSGASLMIPRELFDAVGGFDELYVPAYCEDSDLCFRIRAMGRRVLYQPRSEIVHFEGMSHGTDVKVGVKAYQLRNEERFAERWRAVLDADHFENGMQILRARDRAAHRRVVLIIDHRVPEPDRDAGSRTMMGFIEALLADRSIVKFWPHDGREIEPHTETLRQLGVEVLAGVGTPSLEEWLRHNGAALDLTLVNRPDVAAASLPLLQRYAKGRILYYGYDLHFRRLRLEGESERNDRTLQDADRMEKTERAIWRQVDGVLHPSDEEAAIVARMDSKVVSRAIIPYAFDRFAEPGVPPAGPTLLFVAGFGHPPNEAALVWFVSNVLPALRDRFAELRLAVVGSNPSPRVQALASAMITVHADVSDWELMAWYARARVAIVPLRFGAGVKLKVVEAMARGVPVVTTQVGIQGLPGSESFLRVADQADAFADHVTTLLSDDAAWQQQQAAQLDYARTHFSREVFTAAFLAAIADPAATVRRAA